MGQRMDFSKASKAPAKTNYDYPKFRFKKGEKGRAFLLEFPIREFTHRLNKPMFANGVPVTEQKEARNGTAKTVYKGDFQGNVICHGDVEKLDSIGSDTDKCAMCRAAQAIPDMVERAKRRYAAPVFRIKTVGNSFDPQARYSGDVQYWGFTDTIYERLVDLHEDWDLTKHDLNVELKKAELFQQVEVDIAKTTAYSTQGDADENKKIMEQALRDTPVDLSIVCGSTRDEQWVGAKLKEIENDWAKVKLFENGSEDRGGSLDEGLSSLVESPRATARRAPREYADDERVEPSRTATAVKERPAEDDVPASTPADFDDLFGED